MPALAARVRSLIRVTAPVLVGVLAIVQPGSAVFTTTTTYHFVGTCSDCAGTGTGSLILGNYTLGSAFTTANFLSFSYSSNLISFTIATGSPGINVSGTLPATLPGPANVVIFNSQNQFVSEIPGNAAWCAGTGCLDDLGISGTWSLASATPTGAPAPNTIGLMGVALVTVLLAQILLRRRRNRPAAR
jgi:hypothetical protein